MATTAATLIQRTRRFVRDWPDLDATTASLSSNGTTVTVADTSIYSARWPIEIDSETLLVTSLGSSTTLTVRRGMYGSTAASHATSSSVIVKPSFYTVDILDGINGAKDEMYPYVYKPVSDTSLTSNAATYEFTVPNMPGTYGGDTIVMPFISKIEILITGDVAYRPLRDWTVRRAATPKIVFRSPPVGGTLRVHGFGPFPDLTASTDTVDTLFPKNAESLLPLGAAALLLASGEAGRVRVTAGAVDAREQANRTGSSLSVSNNLYSRWRLRLQGVSMPPMAKNIVSVF